MQLCLFASTIANKEERRKIALTFAIAPLSLRAFPSLD